MTTSTIGLGGGICGWVL